VFCWGDNVYGELGNGTTKGAYTPQSSNELTSNPQLLAAGYYNTVVYTGNAGQAVGWNVLLATPVFVGFDGSGQRFISAIGSSAMDDLICAVTATGTVYCVGDNDTGQLGNGTTGGAVSVPVQVAGLSNATSIAVGHQYACALTANQTVWCWGYNGSAQLGNGTTVQASTPVQVIGLSNVIGLAAGYAHTCAVKNDGTAWCWGDNYNGDLGDGTQYTRPLPVQVQF
jgi:alpha-tubulin suppressor-like RCC1 family protein